MENNDDLYIHTEETLSFEMNSENLKEKEGICPCCKQNIDKPFEYIGTSDWNIYVQLINDVDLNNFSDIVNICPKCGYAELFDNGISDEMKEYIQTDEYRNILLNQNIDFDLKKWILVAMLSEYDNNYTEAGIEYTKAFDYMELKDMQPFKNLIEKAASCFLSAATEYKSFLDGFLAVDSMRRDGEMEDAKKFFETLCNTFEGELVDKLAWKENMWIDLNESEKRYLDIQ